jgi:histone demethylase JARID1
MLTFIVDLKSEVAVEYAADLPSVKFGSGFPSINNSGKNIPKHIKDHAFNLVNISRAPGNLFQVVYRKSEGVSGVTSPWVYMGMLFACFCWHVEDNYMLSLNYMHSGAPKTW